jgi:hypothetical protein
METVLSKDIAYSDTGFLFNPITGESFTVNPMGVDVLNQIREGKPFREICENLVADFQVEIETAERDVMDFFNLLRHYQLALGNERQ